MVTSEYSVLSLINISIILFNSLFPRVQPIFGQDS